MVLRIVTILYVVFRGSFRQLLEFANVHQFDRFGSFFELFSGFVFAILVLSAVGTNTNVNVREN